MLTKLTEPAQCLVVDPQTIAIVTLCWGLNTLLALPMTIGTKWLKSVMLTTRNKIYELSLQPLVAFEFFEWIRSRRKTRCFSHSQNSGRGRGEGEEEEQWKRTVTNQSRPAVIRVTNSFNSHKKSVLVSEWSTTDGLPNIQGVTGGTDQTSGECSLC